MRSILIALLAALVLGSRPAGAGSLELAGGELSLELWSLPAIRLPLASTSVSVSSTGSFTLPAGLLAETQGAVPRSLFTGLPQLSGFSVQSVLNSALDFEGEAGLGVGPLDGKLLVNVLQLFALSVPLHVVGSPGASEPCRCPGLILTVFGQGWTRGTASVTGLDTGPPFFSPATKVFQGSDARSAGHAGSLVLVSPFKMVTNVAPTAAGLATLELRFTPEPRATTLLAIVVALVVWMGRRRRRSQAASSPNCSS